MLPHEMEALWLHSIDWLCMPACLRCRQSSANKTQRGLAALFCVRCHQMRWEGFSLKQRAWLYITNQRRTYEEQPLLLYTLASNRGVLPAGTQLQLPALNEDERSLQETPCRLHVPAVVVLCSARGDASKQGLAGATAAAVPPGSDSSSTGPGMQLLDQVAGDLTACTLEDVFSALKEGMFDAASLSRDAADVLLHRSMAAGDDELLLMLVQADVCLRCSQLALQALLSYAHKVSHMLMHNTVVHLQESCIRY
jgi:hypothetical protein